MALGEAKERHGQPHRQSPPAGNTIGLQCFMKLRTGRCSRPVPTQQFVMQRRRLEVMRVVRVEHPPQRPRDGHVKFGAGRNRDDKSAALAAHFPRKRFDRDISNTANWPAPKPRFGVRAQAISSTIVMSIYPTFGNVSTELSAYVTSNSASYKPTVAVSLASKV